MSEIASTPQPSGIPSTMEPPSAIHEVGVLLVHGIGQQRSGETLVAYGEPMAQWIQQWIDGLSARLGYDDFFSWLTLVSGPGRSPSASPRSDSPELEVLRNLWASQDSAALELRRVLQRVISRVQANAPPGLRGLRGSAEAISRHRNFLYVGGLAHSICRFPDNSPPNFSLDIEIATVNGEVQKSSWLLAEAFWADSFQIPNVTKVSAWSLLVTPWVVANHFGIGIIRAFQMLKRGAGDRSLWERGHALFGAVLRLVLFPLLIPLLAATQAALVALLVCGLIPIDAVRKYTDRALRTFAAVIGDCYAFASSPLRTAQIVERVKRDMEWLAGRCKHLVIVAHSQGAAVTYLTLLEVKPANLRLLVMLGSGLRKLFAMRKIEIPGITEAKLAIYIGCLITIYFMYVGAGYFAPRLTWLPVIQIGGFSVLEIGMSVGTLLLLAMLWIAAGTEDDYERLWAWAESLRADGCKWLDCFSSKDPVPDGPTFDPTGTLGSRFTPPENWTKLEVHNTGSVLFDHTSYARNRDECLAFLICEISACTGSTVPLHLLTVRDTKFVAIESQRRRWRIRHLGYLRTAAIVSVGIVVWARWAQLSDLGGWLAGACSHSGGDCVPSGSEFHSFTDDWVAAVVEVIAQRQVVA